MMGESIPLIYAIKFHHLSIQHLGTLIVPRTVVSYQAEENSLS